MHRRDGLCAGAHARVRAICGSDVLRAKLAGRMAEEDASMRRSDRSSSRGRATSAEKRFAPRSAGRSSCGWFDAVAPRGDDAVEWRRLGRITQEDMVEVLHDAGAVVADVRRALLAS